MKALAIDVLAFIKFFFISIPLACIIYTTAVCISFLKERLGKFGGF